MQENDYSRCGQETPNGQISDEEHVLHLPQTASFELEDDFDFLQKGLLDTVWYVLFRTVVHLIVNVFNRLVYGLRVRGWRNLLEIEGGAVLVCNHVHPMDCTFIDCLIPHKRAYYATLETNFKIPVARHLIRWLGGVPLPTRVHQRGHFFREMERALADGDFVCVYPEGVLRPYYESLRSFKGGAFRLAAEAGCPVIPLAITFREPGGVFFWKYKPCITINILQPVYPDPAVSVRENTRGLQEECRKQMLSCIEEQ